MTLLRIHDGIFSIVDVKKEKKNYRFDAPKIFDDPLTLARELKNKKSIHILFAPSDIIEESITLPAIIKNEATQLSALRVKLHDDRLISESLILNKLYSTSDTNLESTTHRFEGLYEQEILATLLNVPRLEEVRTITAERYALFALAEHAFKGKSYLCVYTQEDKNLIVAVQNGTLLFSRVGELRSEDEIERVMEQISDINRTVAYAHQQYREANFEFIAICGTIADGEMATMQLQSITGLRVAVLAPNLICSGLEQNIAQNYMLEIGMLYLDKTMNFIPDRVKAAREFYWGSTLSVIIALIILIIGLLQSADAYTNYQESLDQYAQMEMKLTQTLRKTDTLDEKQLQQVMIQLKSSVPLNYHFIDDLIYLENIFSIAKPNVTTFEENNGTKVLNINFKHPCKTLLELYLFEKDFKTEAAKLSLPSPEIVFQYQSDYNKLIFDSTLTWNKTDQITPLANGENQ